MKILNKSFIDFIVNPSEDNKLESRVQFVIPCFQRDYVWDKDNHSGVCDGNCKRLIDDIYDIGKTKTDHFFGTFVLQKENSSNNYVIVDGQQRFLTMFLIIKALSVIVSDEDMKKYLNNLIMLEEDKPYISLDKRKEEDVDTLNTIANIPYDYKQVKLIDNVLSKRYKEIFDYIKKTGDVETSLEGLKYLLNSEIVLDDNEDSQIIFERLNYNNARLKEYDLVLNYLLMNETNRESLYKNYWIKIENNVGQEKLESFIHNYVMSRKGEIVNENKVFDEFRKFVESQKKSDDYKKLALKDLHSCSVIYRYILCKDLTAEELKEPWVRLVYEINMTNILTVYPFLIKLFECEEFKPIVVSGSTNRKEEFTKILNIILVFIVKSRICGVTSNKYRQLFVNLYQAIYESNEENNNDKYVAIYNYFRYVKENGFGEFVFKDKFVDRLKECELYHKSSLRDVILNAIEDGRYPNWHNEIVKLDEKRRVEHIFPQTPKEDNWPQKIIEELSPKKHQIGNLSFINSKANIDASNKSFEYKLKLYKESKFTLNKDITKYNEWNLKNFNLRNIELVEKANSLFSVDNIDEEKQDSSLFEKCNTHELTKANYRLFKGTNLVAVKFNNKIHRVKKFYQLGQILAPERDYKGSTTEILSNLLEDNFVPSDLVIYTRPSSDTRFNNRKEVGNLINEIISENDNYLLYQYQFDGDRNFIMDTKNIHKIFEREKFKYSKTNSGLVDTSALIYFSITDMKAYCYSNNPTKELREKLINAFPFYKRANRWNLLYSKEYKATKDSILGILAEIEELVQKI